MPNIVFNVDSTSAVDSVSDSTYLIGNFTLSMADTTTTAGVVYNGVVILEEEINGNWVPSEEFDTVGVFPGFNAVKGKYRVKVKTATTAVGSTGQIVVRGWDKPLGIPY
jgi:hypothetical protein